MSTARRHQRFAIWLALVAMAAMVLLPPLSHVLAAASGGGNGFAEVCTPQGTKLVALADGETAPSGAILLLEHCPYCTAAAGAVGLPPAPVALLLLVAAGTSEPPLFLHAPRTLFAWASANPRAPPLMT